ncbi:MAG: peptidylprolyl isomerase [Verrucomicrobia bacterium]|nr:peptidylprolyl isomerase [Verrucomicrobiota bacterium]
MLTDIRIVIHTAKGDLEVTLFAAKAPLTTANFLNLTVRKYFDGLTFHRVEPRFVIQGGDPLGTGTGGPGYRFKNEIDPSLTHETVGVIAMANAGPDTNGSQFYITLAPFPRQQVRALDGKYSIFGHLTQGLDVANKVRKGDKIESISVLDDPQPLFVEQKSQLEEWNKVLDSKFGSRLGPAPLSNAS